MRTTRSHGCAWWTRTGTLGTAPDLTAFTGDQFAVFNPLSAAEGGSPHGGLEITVSQAPGGAVFAFRLQEDAAGELTVFDVRGRMVRRLLEGESLAAGDRTARWDGRDASGRSAASGVYLFRITAGRERAQGRLVLVR